MPVGPGQLFVNPDGSLSSVIAVSVANPAAGSDFSQTLAAPWTNRLLIQVNGTFATSAVVATRVPRLRVTLGAGGPTILEATATGTQAASSTNRFIWFPGAVAVGAGGEIVSPMPNNMVLPIGAVVTCSTANIDAADQWTSVTLTFSGP